MVQFGGDTAEEADGKAHALIEDVQSDGDHKKPHVAYIEDPAVEDKLSDVREAGLGATAYPPGKHETHEGWEDAAVPPDRLGDYLRDFRKLLERYDYRAPRCTGTSARAACTPASRSSCAPTRASRTTGRSCEDAADLVVGYGGSLSGEHGDGQSRGELLVKMFGPDLIHAFGELKAAVRPGRPDEPRQGRRAEPAGLASAPGAAGSRRSR